MHYHAMYFNYPLFLDNFPATQHLRSNCFLLDKCAMFGLVFNVYSESEKRVQVSVEC